MGAGGCKDGKDGRLVCVIGHNMKKIHNSFIKKFIEIHLPVGVCNMRCSYCYIGQYGNRVKELQYNIADIKKAFSFQRLGGTVLISICSDGETLLHPLISQIIDVLLHEGHYVMVVTNGVLTGKIQELLNLQSGMLDRLFFKLSFHYEEMIRENVLHVFYKNIELLHRSLCSFTVEYTTDDVSLKNVQKFKDSCMENLKVLPHINMPRDERKVSFGILSKFSYMNYCKNWDDAKFDSEFFLYRKQFFCKKYKDFCYAGHRYLWVNLGTGYSHQCYQTVPLQNFMDWRKKIKWIPIGSNCLAAHCYVCYTFFTLGTTETPSYGTYCPSYAEIRNRKDFHKRDWVKPTYQKAFECGVERWECSNFEKRLVNMINRGLKWYRREYGCKYGR